MMTCPSLEDVASAYLPLRVGTCFFAEFVRLKRRTMRSLYRCLKVPLPFGIRHVDRRALAAGISRLPTTCGKNRSFWAMPPLVQAWSHIRQSTDILYLQTLRLVCELIAVSSGLGPLPVPPLPSRY
jgi:hypothetical protein